MVRLARVPVVSRGTATQPLPYQESSAKKGTDMTTIDSTTVAEDVETEAELAQEPVEEVLVEEISIDGMCGVY